ncbi:MULTISPECIES: hypothetical protein [unclassified Pseudoclavibacter]|uniref:hypothetical protein n=1 Tax=unclassified Pseudoclavibacter TaxID=2615177 RepID=UPI0011B0DEE2|nr:MULTISPECIES: hypothetical protein [unclassified Pseudoclavibacter]
MEELVPKFLAAEATASQNGNFSELEALAAGSYVDSVRAGVTDLAAKGHRLVGAPHVSNLSVQSVQPDENGVKISSYACQDISGVDVLDALGNSVQPEGLMDRSTMVYGVVGSGDHFVVKEAAPWPGESFC